MGIYDGRKDRGIYDNLYFMGMTCCDCILDGTDACTRGAGRAVDDEVCEDFLAESEAEDGKID